MNPIINQMNMNNPLAALAVLMRNSPNPEAALRQMALQDERIQTVMNMINQYGGAKQAVYAEAKSRNIDPNSVFYQAQQMLQAH